MSLSLVIRKAEAEYYKESFNSKTRNMKEMWRELGNLLTLSRKNKNNSVSKLIINNNELTNLICFCIFCRLFCFLLCDGICIFGTKYVSV